MLLKELERETDRKKGDSYRVKEGNRILEDTWRRSEKERSKNGEDK